MAAVSGTAFAQSTVTLSGKVRFAYESLKSTTANVATKANGIKVTDGDFVLTAVEDLGAGLKATASMAVLSRGRDTGISGRDASLSLAGNFGSVMIGSLEAGNGILGLGGAGAHVYGLDGPVIAAASNVDIIKYTSPALIPGLTASLSLIDKTAASTNTSVGGTLAMGSTALDQDASVIGLNYASGPLAAAFDMTKYGRNAVTGTVADDRTRLSASYDLGMAKLGFGYQVAATTAATNNKTKDMLVGVNVPMGAMSFGLNYATSQADGAVKVKGFDLGAKYDLSKRTFVAFNYQNVDNKDNASELGATSDAAGATNSNNKFRVQLSHAF